MTQELPQGWTIAALGEIGDINPRHPINLPDGTFVSFAPMPALSTNRPEFESLQERPFGEVRKGYTHFAEGDVLFAKITPCMENGKGAVAVGLSNGLGCGTTEIHVVRPLGRIVPHYIYHFLHQPSVRRQAEANFTGSAGQARVPVNFIKELAIPLPPLAEQQRIVAKLEVLLGKVDACRKRLERIPVILKRFRQSILAAACSGRLTADWREDSDISEGDREFFERVREQRLLLCKTSTETQRIEQSFSLASSKDSMESDNWLPMKAELICDFITKGTTPKEIENGDHGDIPFLKVYNIVGNKIDFSAKPQFVSRKTHEGILRRSAVYPGDVLMNIVGPPLAKVAVVPKRYPEWNINQAIAVFRPVGSVNSEFLRIALLGSKNLREIIAHTRGIVGQSNLSLEQCRNLEVEVPPLPEQHEIVRRVEALFALVDQIETRYAKAKTHVDRLTQSILAKAFRGDLVPQDSNDEPASVLLERIQSQRQDAGTSRKKIRRNLLAAAGAAGRLPAAPNYSQN
ncbi:MAG: restriction endonuclease subunit S [Candidatus Geothermincolia bacterium]